MKIESTELRFLLSFNLITNIIVLDNISNKPYIKYNGNRIQYILTSEVDTLSNGTGVYEYDENKIINYGIILLP